MNAFFGSRWAPCHSDMVQSVRAPFNREVIDTVPVCNAETVDVAIRKLAEHRTAFENFPCERIGPIFAATAGLLRQRSAEISRLISREQGKPLSESTDEVSVAANLLDSFAREAYRLGRQFQPLAVEARVGDRFGFTRQRPIGIEAIITPNTFPLLIPVKLITPAIAAGNVVILKPASATPLSSLRMVELFLEAGLPPTAIACLTGPGNLTGQAICRHPLVDQVCCYGGIEAIRAIRGSLGLIPLQFHHGGMTACAVTASANIDLAVRSIVTQGFENAGQTAISAGTVFVETPVYEEFVHRLAELLRALPAGDPLHPATRIGPLTEEARAARATQMVENLLSQGGRLAQGNGQRQGSLMAPTLIADVPLGNPSVFAASGSRELLSPIMSITRIEGDLEQIRPWLDRRTQPALAIFTKDLERASLLASKMPVFNVHINGVPTWRDGVIFSSQASSRLGRSQSDKRVREVSTVQDIVFHP